MEGLVLRNSGFPLRVDPHALRAQKGPAGRGLQVFGVKSLWRRGGYRGGVAENQHCLLHPLLIKAKEKEK